MQPSDYIPNEPERNPLHEFICASVAACVASVYPRADPERFVKIVNRTKAPACIVETEHPPASPRAPETASEYIVRTFSEALDREHARRLRALSYERACESSAAVHCASTDWRDNNSDRAFVVYSDPGPAPKITLADIDAEKAIQSALEAARVSAHPDAGPAGTD